MRINIMCSVSETHTKKPKSCTDPLMKYYNQRLTGTSHDVFPSGLWLSISIH